MEQATYSSTVCPKCPSVQEYREVKAGWVYSKGPRIKEPAQQRNGGIRQRRLRNVSQNAQNGKGKRVRRVKNACACVHGQAKSGTATTKKRGHVRKARFTPQNNTVKEGSKAVYMQGRSSPRKGTCPATGVRVCVSCARYVRGPTRA